MLVTSRKRTLAPMRSCSSGRSIISPCARIACWPWVKPGGCFVLELWDEAQLAGLVVEGLFGVEGPAWTMPDLDAWLEDPMRRAKLLAALRRVETEISLLGASANLLLVGRRP